MKSLQNLLKKKFPGGNSQQKMVLDDKTVFFVFKKSCGRVRQFGDRNFQPDYFSGHTIFIKCQSSNWASELWLNKNKIIRKINKELGEDIITDIKSK